MIEYITKVTNESTSTPLSETLAPLQAVDSKNGALAEPCLDAVEFVPLKGVILSPSNTGPELFIRESGEQERLMFETVLVPNQ